jgi:hypothetical protein
MMASSRGGHIGAVRCARGGVTLKHFRLVKCSAHDAPWVPGTDGGEPPGAS